MLEVEFTVEKEGIKGQKGGVARIFEECWLVMIVCWRAHGSTERTMLKNVKKTLMSSLRTVICVASLNFQCVYIVYLFHRDVDRVAYFKLCAPIATPSVGEQHALLYNQAIIL